MNSKFEVGKYYQCLDGSVFTITGLTNDLVYMAYISRITEEIVHQSYHGTRLEWFSEWFEQDKFKEVNYGEWDTID